ncbi:hypothetical protein ACFMJM_20390, partial [Acinetobacter baumannii]
MEQMRWLELLSAVRLGSKKSSTELARSPFHKDYDRIIFSQSFRQLNRKTQVHRLERGLLFTLKGVSEISNEVKQVLHD